MKETLHYYLMANHNMFQKALFANIKETELSLGQPKILDYLIKHDGEMQKEIAANCHIEPASLTSVLAGMEKKGLVTRRTEVGNRRSLYVFLTDKGKNLYAKVDQEFSQIEKQALKGFSNSERQAVEDYLDRIYKNMKEGL